jgi:penicillin-binding protein 1C
MDRISPRIYAPVWLRGKMLARRAGQVIAATRRRRLISALTTIFAALFVWGYATARFVAPPATPFLLDRTGHYLAQIPVPDDGGYGYWQIEQLPPRVVAATLALEDRRFWLHPGIDPIAIGRALMQNLASDRRISGASTLAMQVARMQDPGPRDYRHKIREAVTAFFLTIRYGHEAVLRQYLRLVPYGNGSHGIAHAARFYLDKPVADLSWAEIAFLTAIPQAPGRMNPLSFQARVAALARGHRILSALAADQVISPTELALAQAQLDNLPIMQRQARPDATLHAILNLQRRVIAARGERQVTSDPRIVTTIDPAIQRQVDDLANRYLNRWRSNGAEQVAVVVTEMRSNEVLAWLGSADYFGSSTGAIDFAQALRSPGSTLKPFIYALALDRGAITPSTPLLDEANDAGTIENADHDFLGALMPRQALANSRNVPAANLVRLIGLDETYLYFRLLGLQQDDHPAAYYGLSLAIGAMPSSLERLARAYGALGNDGVMRDLVWYRGQAAGPETRVMSADAARLITQFLADPSARLPSFPRMGSIEYPFPVAVKTGTSQGYRDAWTMAYSTKYLVGVWIGRADAGPMRDVAGAQSAGELARSIMLSLYGEPPYPANMAFAAPEHYRLQDTCSGTPDADISGCASRLPEWHADQGKPGSNLPVTAASQRVAEQTILGGDKPGQLRIVSPKDNLRLIRNPEVPADLSILTLKANLAVMPPPSGAPAPAQLLWYVDGKPYQLAAAGDAVRWPLQTGTHTFQAKVPYSGVASRQVTIEVQ